jgi:hypothetical protein
METLDIAVALAIIFAFGWYLGAKVQSLLDQLTFRSILQDLGVSNRQLLNLIKDDLAADHVEELSSRADEADGLDVVEVTLERRQGVIYAYRKDTSQFLGQGTDQDSLISSIAHRLKGVRLVIQDSDGADLLQKNNG